MRKRLIALAISIFVLGCGGDSTSPQRTLTADQVNGVWDFSFSAADACGGLRNAVVPARLSFEGNAEIANTVSGWTSNPSGTPDQWPLIGNINFPTRTMELRFWTVILDTGFDVIGTVSQDGTSFTGTAVDPIPGYTPVASLGQCSYDVSAHQRSN